MIAMAKENCPYAYRKLGDVSIHCKKIEGSMDYCAYTYMCPHSKRFEVSPAGQSCKLKKKPTKP